MNTSKDPRKIILGRHLLGAPLKGSTSRKFVSASGHLLDHPLSFLPCHPLSEELPYGIFPPRFITFAAFGKFLLPLVNKAYRGVKASNRCPATSDQHSNSSGSSATTQGICSSVREERRKDEAIPLGVHYTLLWLVSSGPFRQEGWKNEEARGISRC